MAGKTIKQRISLDGGEEIKSVLKQIGDAGRQAFENISSAIKEAGDASSPLAQSLDRLQAQYKRFQNAANNLTLSTRDLRLQFSELSAATSVVVSRLGLLTAAAGGAVTAFALMTKQGLQSVDQLAKQAEGVGLTVEAYQALVFAAQQAGLEQTQFGQAVTSLNVKIAAAIENAAKAGTTAAKTSESNIRSLGSALVDTSISVTRISDATKKAADEASGAGSVFAELGISLQDLKTLGTEALLRKIADAFQKMPDGIDKSRIAAALFEKELGAKLIPLLNGGSRGLDENAAAIRRFGLEVTTGQAEVAQRANDAVSTIGTILTRFRDQVALIFAPDIEQGANALADILYRNRDAIVDFAKSVSETARVFGQDLVAMLEGRDIDVQNSWLLTLRDTIIAFGEAVRFVVTGIVIPTFKTITSALEPVAGAINALFGTKLTGATLLFSAALIKVVGGFRLLGAAFGVVRAGALAFIDLFRYVREGGRLVSTFFTFLRTTGVGAFAALRIAAGGFLSGFASAFGKIGLLFKPLLSIIGRVGLALVGLAGAPGLVIAGFALLAFAVYTYWDDIVAFGQKAWARIVATYDDIADSTKQFASDTWDGLKERAKQGWDLAIAATREAKQGLTTAAEWAWSGITEAAISLGAEIAPVWEGIKSTAASAFRSVADLVLEAWSGATDSVRESAEAIQAAIQRATEIAGDVAGASEMAAQLVAPFLDARAQIQSILDSLGGIASGALSAVYEAVDTMADDIERRIASLLSSLRSALAEARRLAREIASAQSSSGGSGGDRNGAMPGYATGGYVSGPGTATSDSILARLSRGEFVIRAAAVEKYGPDLLAAINGLRFPIPKFSAGGIVDGINNAFASLAPVPAFAAGGMVPATASPGRPINLTIGGETFPVRADEDVATQMVRYAKKRAASQVSRKPWWAGS